MRRWEMAKQLPDDQLYVTWFIPLPGGRKKEVDIFEFIFRGIGITAQQWNTEGLGSVIFKKGSLRIGEWTAGSAPQANMEAQAFVLNLKPITEGTNYDTIQRGLDALYTLLANKSKMIELETKAYGQMMDVLRVYLENPGSEGGNKKVSAFIMPSQYRKTSHSTDEKIGGHIKRKEGWSDTFRFKDRNYTNRWHFLLERIVLNKKPKIAGGAVLSFSLADLLTVQLTPTNSPLKSIFMMEEFGTGVMADPALRRPFRGAATPFKVPQSVADAFGEPTAIFMWWPFLNFRIKAKLLFLAKLKRGSGAASRWLEQTRNTHAKMQSLEDYRKHAYGRIKFYNEEKKKLGKSNNPLDWAYGRGPSGDHGHPGREARHLFFNRNGLVPQLAGIQRAGYVALMRLVDAEIAKTVPNFPSLEKIIFPQTI